MSPTEGVIGEAWGHYKAHWRHLLPIALVVYVAIAIIGALLTLVLGWFGALVAAIISLVGLFWVQGALVKAVEDIRDGRADLSLGETFDRVRPQLGSIIVAGLLAGLGIVVGLVLLIVPGLYLLGRLCLVLYRLEHKIIGVNLAMRMWVRHPDCLALIFEDKDVLDLSSPA